MTSRPLVARISSDALTHNLAVARRLAAGAKVMAIIKADGYGHGLEHTAQALWAADGFGVLSLDEAIRLRDQGWTRPILLLEGFFDAEELPAFFEHGLTPVIHSSEQIAMLEAACAIRRLPVFLKINTGMNRLGIDPAGVSAAVARLGACAEVTLMTHFACADDATGIESQLHAFQAATAGYELPVSLANSAALIRFREARRGWVRPGIMLYGVSPVAGMNIGLRPAMTLASRIITVRKLKAGAGVGYGATFVADRDMRIGVVACGYADGYPRHAGTGTPILVGGRRTRTLGRVSMDMLIADISDLVDAGVGTEVVLWGDGLPVEEVAAAADTISYELLTARAARVPVVVA